MSRSGYNDSGDIEAWDWIRWRGAVTSAMRGRRGQAFLRETLAALDAMPAKKLIAEELDSEGAVCTLGAVGKARGLDMSILDPQDRETVADVFGIPFSMLCEIVYENDEGACTVETPEQRWRRMRRWVEAGIRPNT